MIFRHIVDFSYKNEKYQLYLSEKYKKYAFLKGEFNSTITYPSVEELVELTKIFSETKNVYNIKGDINKKYNFIPKIKYQGALILLTTALLTGCSPSRSTTRNYSTPTSTTVSSNEVVKKTKVLDFEKFLAPADDSEDYKYANDFEHRTMTKVLKFRDAKAIRNYFDLPEINEETIKEICDKNPNISPKYKEFILNYIKDWDRLYPGSNHDVFYINLKSLKIIEADQQTIKRKALATDAKACYIQSENTIYVRNDIDISKESDGYIELTHELSHAARMFDFKDEETGYTYISTFKDDYALGTYTEEALITDFAYEMQGLGNKSHYYALASSYFRIILDVIDYDGADYTNHSINYLIDKLNEYMQTDEAAYILAQIESQATIRFTPYMEVAYTEFDDLYDYMVRLYMSKYLNENMSYEEALVVFNNFYDEINFHYENIYSAYGITPDSFRPSFEQCVDKLGIERNESLER